MKPSELSKKISELRNQKGMTQKELSEVCNIDIRTIQRIESGEVVPRKHTLKLLASILGSDLSNFNTGAVSNGRDFNKEIKLAFVPGLIFSINAIPVVFDLITRNLSKSAHMTTILIHIVSCFFFSRGFYFLGKRYNNQVMEISFLLSMILLPLINVMELLTPYYFNPQLTTTIFTLLCLNAIFSGLGLLIETYKRKNYHRINFYKIGGVFIIIQSAMFLSPDFNIVSSGLIISLGTNLLLLTILYSEYTGVERTDTHQADQTLAYTRPARK